MSTSALMTAIYGRLVGTETLTGDALTAQQGIASTLATDPVTNAPAVFYGNLSRSQELSATTGNRSPLYPCITFRQGGGVVNKRFGLTSGAIGTVLVDFEIWSDSQSPLTVNNIFDYLERLIDYRRGEVSTLPTTTGYIYNAQAMGELNVIYDNGIHAWAGLITYAFNQVRYE